MRRPAPTAIWAAAILVPVAVWVGPLYGLLGAASVAMLVAVWLTMGRLFAAFWVSAVSKESFAEKYAGWVAADLLCLAGLLAGVWYFDWRLRWAAVLPWFITSVHLYAALCVPADESPPASPGSPPEQGHAGTTAV